MIGLLIDSSTGDLMIRNGGLALGESSQQVIEHALVAFRGEYREQPLIGAEVRKQRFGVGSRLWCAQAKLMCKTCGVPVSKITLSENNTITIR